MLSTKVCSVDSESAIKNVGSHLIYQICVISHPSMGENAQMVRKFDITEQFLFKY